MCHPFLRKMPTTACESEPQPESTPELNGLYYYTTIFAQYFATCVLVALTGFLNTIHIFGMDLRFLRQLLCRAQPSAKPHDAEDSNQATEFHTCDKLETEMATDTSPSLSSIYSPSPSNTKSSTTTCAPSNLTSAFDPGTANTKANEQELLKHAFKSMVRKRQGQCREWRLLRQAELMEQPSPEHRVRSWFGIKLPALWAQNPVRSRAD